MKVAHSLQFYTFWVHITSYGDGPGHRVSNTHRCVSNMQVLKAFMLLCGPLAACVICLSMYMILPG